jgi:hypothetical protein
MIFSLSRRLWYILGMFMIYYQPKLSICENKFFCDSRLTKIRIRIRNETNADPQHRKKSPYLSENSWQAAPGLTDLRRAEISAISSASQSLECTITHSPYKEKVKFRLCKIIKK